MHLVPRTFSLTCGTWLPDRVLVPRESWSTKYQQIWLASGLNIFAGKSPGDVIQTRVEQSERSALDTGNLPAHVIDADKSASYLHRLC